jgi:hypothetical protein
MCDRRSAAVAVIDGGRSLAHGVGFQGQGVGVGVNGRASTGIVLGRDVLT